MLMGGDSSYCTLGEACCSAWSQETQETGPRALDRIILPYLVLASPAPYEVLKLTGIL